MTQKTDTQIKELQLNKRSSHQQLKELLEDGWEIKGYAAAASFSLIVTTCLLVKKYDTAKQPTES